MRNRSSVLALCVAVALCLGYGNARAAPVDGSTGSVDASTVGRYKTEMDAKRWAQAYALSMSLTDQAPTSALAWYRRARAAVFFAKWDDARQSLDKAKALDGAMSFSQDPARVKALESTIVAGLASQQPTAELVPTPVTITASAASTPASAPEVVQKVTVVAVTDIPVVAPLKQVHASEASLAKSEQTKGLMITLIFLALMAIVSIGLATAIWRSLRNARNEFSGFLAKVDKIQVENADLHALADVFEGMTRIQREVHGLRALLESQKLTGTAIYEALEGFLPTLERNIGLAPMHELELRGMSASGTSQEEVTRRLLQMHRTGRYTVGVPKSA